MKVCQRTYQNLEEQLGCVGVCSWGVLGVLERVFRDEEDEVNVVCVCVCLGRPYGQGGRESDGLEGVWVFDDDFC